MICHSGYSSMCKEPNSLQEYINTFVGIFSTRSVKQFGLVNICESLRPDSARQHPGCPVCERPIMSGLHSAHDLRWGLTEAVRLLVFLQPLHTTMSTQQHNGTLILKRKSLKCAFAISICLHLIKGLVLKRKTHWCCISFFPACFFTLLLPHEGCEETSVLMQLGKRDA